MTQFIGWSAEQVADKEDVERWEDLHWWLHTWGRLLRDRGVATLYESVTQCRRRPGAGAASRPSGERFMTDLRHIAQLLHEAAVTEGVGPTALANWLGRRILEADRDGENEERTRRLESDAEAVQVITIHRSKGLEFPVVLMPVHAWDGWAFPIDVPVFHDPDNGERAHHRRRAAPGPSFAVHKKMAGGRGAGREPASALRRPDAGPPPGGAVVGRGEGHAELAAGAAPLRPGARWPDPGEREEGALRRGRRRRPSPTWAARSRSSASAEPPAIRWQRGRESSSELGVAVFDRDLDIDWRRASYSSITSAVHEQPAIASEPEARRS